MAGTVTVTETREDHFSVHKIDWSWLSASDGAADKASIHPFTGVIEHVEFIPGATTPTTAYDVTIVNPLGVDILNGNGADLSSAATVVKTRTGTNEMLSVSNEILTLNVSNAGDAKNGRVVLYIIG